MCPIQLSIFLGRPDGVLNTPSGINTLYSKAKLKANSDKASLVSDNSEQEIHQTRSAGQRKLTGLLRARPECAYREGGRPLANGKGFLSSFHIASIAYN
jgi:hypothetical protein